MSRDIPDSQAPGCGGVESPSGHHRCRRRGSFSCCRWQTDTASPAPGSMSCWPATERRARRHSSHDRGVPQHVPERASPEPTVALIVTLRTELVSQGLDAGADTIAWHLEHHHQLQVAPGTIARHLHPPRTRHSRTEEATQVLLHPLRRRPAQPVLAVRLHPLPPRPMATDDRDPVLARRPLPLRPLGHRPPPGHRPDRARHFRDAVAQHGIPASTLTDNGMVFTTRLAGGRGGRNGFEAELARLGITQKNSSPNHPTTCGKVERFQQTMKKWLRAQPDQPTTLDRAPDPARRLRRHLQQPPPAPLPRRTGPPRPPPTTPDPKPPPPHPATTPTTASATTASTTPASSPCASTAELHHIGIGRTHARTRVLLLIHDLDIRVIDAATGELLRELTLDPTRTTNPPAHPKDPPNENTPNLRVRGVHDVLRHHKDRLATS